LKGMLHELQDEAVEAFNVYETIASPALKHIALKKMLPIAMTLKDFDAALIVLERLCQISLEYMVSYADLLGLLGNKKAAIEVLMMYLGQFPDRPSVKNKLAQYYIDEGQLDEAKAQLEAVLAKDENNRTAQHLMNLVAEA
ncbi:MAG: tetratricopeptide repeat protein, partial [Thiomicrospira sp.]